MMQIQRQPYKYHPIKLSLFSSTHCCGIIIIMQQDLPSCNSMSTTTPTTIPPCQNNHPSKAAVIIGLAAPTCSSSKSNNIKPSFGLHEEVKVEDGCSNNKKFVVQAAGSISSLLVSSHEGSNDVNVEALQKDSGRERLKRHRDEVAGRVLIPDKWDKEELLKDWIDYSSFDSLLAPSGLASARRALMEEGRRMGSQRLRIESMC